MAVVHIICWIKIICREKLAKIVKKWFFEYQKSKKYWLELFFLFRQKKVNLGNIFELNLKDKRSQRVYLWSEDTTVHCVQRSQYLKGHKETICVWKHIAYVSFHEDIISNIHIWKLPYFIERLFLNLSKKNNLEKKKIFFAQKKNLSDFSWTNDYFYRLEDAFGFPRQIFLGPRKFYFIREK